jgi:hypothetical protein
VTEPFYSRVPVWAPWHYDAVGAHARPQKL